MTAATHSAKQHAHSGQGLLLVHHSSVTRLPPFLPNTAGFVVDLSASIASRVATQHPAPTIRSCFILAMHALCQSCY